MELNTKIDEIGKNIDKIINDKHYSRNYIANKLDIPYSSLCDFLNDNSGRKYIQRLEEISNVLNITKINITLINNHETIIKEDEEAYNALFDPSILLPEYRKQFEHICKKNEQELIRLKNIREKYNIKD